MADIDKALVHFLKSDNQLDALVDGRIYPIDLPQSVVLPAIAIQDISLTVRQPHGEASTLPRPRYQITAWGSEFADVVEVTRNVQDLMDGYQGSWGTAAYVTDIESCLLTDQRDFKDPETGLYQRQQDYFVMYKE